MGKRMYSLKRSLLMFFGGMLLSHSGWGETKYASDKHLNKNLSQELSETPPNVLHKSGMVRPQQEESEQEITIEKILYGLGRQDRDSEPQNTFEKLTVRERNLAQKGERWQKNINLVLEATKNNEVVQDMRSEFSKVWNEQLSLQKQIEERIAAVMKELGYAPMSTGSFTYESKSGKSVFNVIYNINSGKIELQNMRK